MSEQSRTPYLGSTSETGDDGLNKRNMNEMLERLKFLDAEDAQIEAEITDHFAKTNGSGASHEPVLPSKSNERILEERTLTEIEKHANLSWTTCYDPDCQTHLSDKEGSRWFPKKPKKATWSTQQSGKVFTQW